MEKTFKINIDYGFRFRTFFIQAEDERQALRRFAISLFPVIEEQKKNPYLREQKNACWCMFPEKDFVEYLKGWNHNSFGWEYVNTKAEGADTNVWLFTHGMTLEEYVKGKRTGGHKVVFTNPDNPSEILSVRVRKNSHYTDFTQYDKGEKPKPEYLVFEFTFNKGRYHYCLDLYHSGKSSLMCKPVTEERQVWKDFKSGLDGKPMRFELRELRK